MQAGKILPAYEIVNRDTICNIFFYSPAPDKGLHLAYLGDDRKYHDLGMLFSCDYGQWGSEKKMYTPFVTQGKDGGWYALWSVNRTSPVFAVSYSEDMITWRPQDYPIIKEKGVTDPIAYQMDDGSWDLYVKTQQGKRYIKADKEFRHFTEDSIPAEVDEILWEQETHEVDGKSYKGCVFDVPVLLLNYASDWFEQQHAVYAQMKDTRKVLEQKSIAPISAQLIIDETKTKKINPRQTGIFFEDISYAADGGIWAELLQNGDFEYNGKEDHAHSWTPSSFWTGAEIKSDNPLSANNPHYSVLRFGKPMTNTGWDGISDSGSNYNFSAYVRNETDKKNQLVVSLIADNGTVLAEEKIKLEGKGWKKVTLPLTTINKKRTPGKINSHLQLSLKKEGAYDIDMVSLMPAETFHSHGFRKDLCDTIAALKPGFVRFPGGCMLHGDGLENIYNWKESIGDFKDRKPARNLWGYHQTRRLGFFEYFQWCEDMGAEPLPVLAAGVPCQNSAANADGVGGQQGGIEDMDSYIQDVLDLIEYANGDAATSKWAKKRAEAGHPSPFNLKMIGIGNEDLQSTVFKERYLAICKAIHNKYPEMKVIGTVGPFHYPSSDYVEGWKTAKANKDLFYAVDEHYYEQPEWFVDNQDYYDNYDRKAPKVYLGEYASRSKDEKLNAAAEGLHLINMERNGDVVDMTSFAPLLSRNGHSNWSPDMIYFDNDNIKATPSYQVQKLFSHHSGDIYVSSQLKLPASQEKYAKYLAASIVKNTSTGKTWLKIANTLNATLTLQVKGKNITVDGRAVKVYEL